jgi:tRNA(Arg) A34 adenosine deaminase TadA
MAFYSRTNDDNVVSAVVVAAFVVAAQALTIGMLWKRKQQQGDNDAQHPACGGAVVVTLPAWASKFYDTYRNKTFVSEEEMMDVAIALSDRNVTEKTGGPFGTAIFECDTKTGDCTLFSIGMNQVVSLNNSTLHGEMTAIQFGQKKLKNFTFGSSKAVGKEYHLYTSCEPCCQCLGGTLWSGVSKLVCAAAKDDAEAIGFDEGPVFPQSYDALERAGVRVVRNVLRKEGAEVLQKYAKTGVIYNA